jgi:hypothetical protein
VNTFQLSAVGFQRRRIRAANCRGNTATLIAEN